MMGVTGAQSASAEASTTMEMRPRLEVRSRSVIGEGERRFKYCRMVERTKKDLLLELLLEPLITPSVFVSFLHSWRGEV